MSASDDCLLMAKQFMQIAFAMCPKDTGLLSTTIRSENTHYLGMSAVNVYVGSNEAYYMPYTNEEWKSVKAFPKSRKSRFYRSEWEIFDLWNSRVNPENPFARKLMNEKRTFPQFKKDYIQDYKKKYGEHPYVRKNPNEHWWDKAIAQVVNLSLDQEKGIMIHG